MKILAKNFILRSELEDFIRAEITSGSEQNVNHTIEGTNDELRRLQLSDKRNVLGIKVVCTENEYKTKNKLEEKLKAFNKK